ncbi:aldehyde:ferredoxin oxidoreductase [Longilinea arvoryzae]|uniref:Aldehyde:ferredoxin oxidoreductase n=1 Tax=Longilinea arvoryzae TaxID=360412 RepID=A0A0S7BHB0_9CHLR|nr:aldehyde ferredoxin oxidoreductase family protein [Longilinea arvoryzae]GAP13971.1 aldehyde:ferredoxin oxidoreductase [Longilinea arvoryzae]
MKSLKYQGYAGQYLRIDLTNGTIEKDILPLDWVENYLGGNGIGVKILWDEVPARVKPLSLENKLIVATGPLCGSSMPNSGRLEFIAKSPLTGIYGDSNAGGHFGPELKFAGYDLIIFEGRSATPVYLFICDQQVTLCPADEIWGKGIFDTETWLRQRHHDPDLKVAAIGPAGENLVRYASIQVTPRRSAARSGMGAVMGSKNLKAIAVRGHSAIPMHDPEKLIALTAQLQQNLRKHPFFKSTHLFGTPGLVALMQPIGRFPTQNFRYGSYEAIDDILGETLREKHLDRDTACFNCPLGCDKVYTVENGEFKDTLTTSVEYETLNAFGARVCNHNLPAVLKGNEICDDLGMDTISAGNAISFAMELWEKGILKESECDGLDLSWGNYHTLLELLRRIAYREGALGDTLAEGAARAARWYGRNSERYAMHVKGQDIPAQDGRAQQSMGLAHATSSRGADHLKAFPVLDESGTPDEALKRYDSSLLPDLVNPLAVQHKAMLVKDGEDYGAVVDSSGNCKSGGTFVMAEIYWKDQAEAIQAATGLDLDVDRLKVIGERIYNLQRCYNALHGITRADDTLPWRFTAMPSPSGNARGSVCQLGKMLQDYYALRGWDPIYGLPTVETLERLGLGDIAAQLECGIHSESVKTIYNTLGWAAPYTEWPGDPL